MIYVALFLFSFVLTYFIKNYAIKKLLVDIPNERSSHTSPTPHGGGIAIAFTWFSGITYLFFTNTIETPFYLALMAGLLLSVVSYIDDLIELSPKIRLFTQALVAFWGLYALGGFEQLNLFFFIIENQFITNIFAFFMIIWFINLYNFLDGIDGYAGSEAVFLSVAAFVLFGDSVFVILGVAVLGFLFWNWHKAKIFMGDVGSTLLGYNIAIFTLYSANKEPSNLWIWLVLFSLFWFDATLTLFRRYKNGEKLSKAHRKHAYQRLVQSGWTHKKVVLASILLNSILLLSIYVIPSIYIVFVITLVLLFMVTKFIDTKKEFI